MALLDLVKELKEESICFKDHPAKKLSLKEKENYIKGLVLVMEVDSEMNNKEKEYLTGFIKSIGLPKDKLDHFMKFSKNTTKDDILEIIEVIKTTHIADIFLLDCLMISKSDAILKDSEEAILTLYSKLLGIDRKFRKKLNNIANSLKGDIDKKYQKGKTALIYLTEIGSLHFIEFLIDHEADLDIQDDSGKTALMVAAKSGNKDIVELLIDSGADISLLDNDKNSAYNLTKDEEIKNILNSNLEESNLKTVENEKIVIEQEKLYSEDLKFINCEIEFDKDGKIKFSDNRTMEFVNCKFISPVINLSNSSDIKIINSEIIGKKNQNTKIYGKNLKNISIINTKFSKIKNKETKILHFKDSDNCDIFIEKCKFDSCKVEEFANASHLIYFDDVDNIEIKNNIFKECISISSFSSSYLLYFYDINSGIIDKNSFENCKSSKDNIYLKNSDSIEIIE